MSKAERAEQERQADLFQIIRKPDEVKQGTRTDRAKVIAEGIGIGWFLRRVTNIFTD
jgi:hypothetical protein